MQRQLLLAELAHELGLVFDKNDFPLMHHADAISHLFGFIDIMRGQDDRDAVRAERAHDVPHVLAQLDVDAGRRFVQKEDLRLVRERLGDQHPAFHAAGQRHDLAVFLVPERQLLDQLCYVIGIARLAEESAAEGDRCPDRFEGIGREFLRDETDHRSGHAVISADVVTGD